MKTFLVSGIAFVPVDVRFKVEASNAENAMKKANRLFLNDRDIRQSSVIMGSEDFGAIHSFDATNAEVIKP